MREQDVHHEPVPGQQLSPQRPASTHSHAQGWGQAACHCSIFSPAHLDIPGWTRSCQWLILAILSVCRQQGFPEEPAGREVPPIWGPGPILTQQNHSPCKAPCWRLLRVLAAFGTHTCRAGVTAQHLKVFPFHSKHKSCFTPCSQKKRRRGD